MEAGGASEASSTSTEILYVCEILTVNPPNVHSRKRCLYAIAKRNVMPSFPSLSELMEY